MSKQPSRRTKKQDVRASFTRNQLCEMLSTDPRTVDRRCSVLGITPEPRHKRTDPTTYRLTDDQVQSLKQPLQRGAAQYAGSSGLHQEKLKEEVERLKLRNSKLRDEVTPNTELSVIFAELATSTATILKQKLEIEWPVQCAGLTADEIREVTHQTVAEITAKWDSEAAKWAKYRE